jgi:hypothetical protein
MDDATQEVAPEGVRAKHVAPLEWRGQPRADIWLQRIERSDHAGNNGADGNDGQNRRGNNQSRANAPSPAARHRRMLVEAHAPWLGARRRLAGPERCDLRHRLGAHAWRSLGFNSA